MYTLTDDEKDRLRAEIEYRVAINRALEVPKGKLVTIWLTIWSVLNTPVFITVIGGIIITCLSNQIQNSYAISQQELQHSYAISQQESQYQKQLRDNKVLLFSSFAREFEQQFNVLYGMHVDRAHYNNLLKSIKKDSNLKENQNLKNTKENFDKLADEDRKNHHIISTIYSVQALFRNADVLSSAENLEKQVAHMNANDDLSESQYIEIGKNVYQSYKDLLKKMGNEINGSSQLSKT